MSKHPEYRLTGETKSTVRGALNAYIDNLPDKVFIVSITEETRSLAQNAYLWSGVYPSIVNFMRDHHGRDYSNDAIHETLKELFLPFKVEQMAKREIRIYRSTKKLTKSEFAEYVEHIIRWSAEFGCVISEPTWPNWKIKQLENAA